MLELTLLSGPFIAHPSHVCTVYGSSSRPLLTSNGAIAEGTSIPTTSSTLEGNACEMEQTPLDVHSLTVLHNLPLPDLQTHPSVKYTILPYRSLLLSHLT